MKLGGLMKVSLGSKRFPTAVSDQPMLGLDS